MGGSTAGVPGGHQPASSVHWRWRVQVDRVVTRGQDRAALVHQISRHGHRGDAVFGAVRDSGTADAYHSNPRATPTLEPRPLRFLL